MLDRLETAAREAPPDLNVPVHRSFQPAQVLDADGRISFIDFDKSSQSEAASDIATFTTKVHHASLNKPNAGTVKEDDLTRRRDSSGSIVSTR